jgi:hypothetical protein
MNIHLTIEKNGIEKKKPAYPRGCLAPLETNNTSKEKKLSGETTTEYCDKNSRNIAELRAR